MWRLLKRLTGSERAAEGAAPGPTRRSAFLSPTANGAALGANGRAEISADGEWQRFMVQVNANIADGAVLTLMVNGRPVAPIEIADSAGEFEIAASEGLSLPNGVQDVGGIKTLAVATQEGVFVLTGAFERDDRAA